MSKVDKEKLKEARKDAKKKLGKGASEFKDFLMQGDVVDLAVGVVIGGAFGKIVTALVNNILMPIVGILVGGLDFTNLSIDILDAKIMYGEFIQAVVDFLIVAFCIFLFIKVIGGVKAKLIKEEEAEEAEAEEEKKSDEVALLEEIRDLLKNQNK